MSRMSSINNKNCPILIIDSDDDDDVTECEINEQMSVEEKEKSTTTPTNHHIQGRRCVVCLDEEKQVTHLFVPCGHLALCSECGTLDDIVENLGHSCPLCRNEIDIVIKLFY